MAISVSGFHCVRFQYQKGTLSPPPFDTLPFYQVQIRSFLRHNYGRSMWLKGNAGGERAAWLLYDSSVANQVEKLLSQPLESGRRFKVTATLENAGEILRRYTGRGDLEVVGKMDFPEVSLGSKEIPHPGAKDWWEKYDWKTGFFYLGPRYGDKKQYWHISANQATPHEDKKGPMLCLHNCVQVAISYNGDKPPGLYVDKQDESYFWELDIRKLIEEGITLEQVRSEEPEWNDFLGAIKLGGE